MKNQLGLKALHDATRVFDETEVSMQITRSSVTEEKTSEAASVRRRRTKIEEALRASKVAKPLAKWLIIGINDVFGPGAEFRHTAMGTTQQISHPFSRSSLQQRFRHAQRENRTQSDKLRRQDDEVGRHDTSAVG